MFIILYVFIFNCLVPGAQKTDFLKFSLELVHKLLQSETLEVCKYYIVFGTHYICYNVKLFVAF